MERTLSSSGELAPPKEIKCIEELSLSQLSDVLSPSRPVESVAEETLKSSSKKSSPTNQEPVVAAKKSARIANSSSRYKKFNLLVSGIGLSKKLTPSNPTSTSNHNSNIRASTTNTATSVKTAGKIKLGFNLILNKNRNKTENSIVGKQDEENDDENIEEDDETANDEESNDEVVSNSSKLLSTSSISFTSEQTHKKNNTRSSIDLSISHNSFLNKSSDSIATTERKSQITMDTETIEDMDNEIENSFNDINNNMNASQQQQRTGPRVKHVSRYPVTYLNQVDNLMSLDTGSVSAPIKKHFYHELKSINQDFSSQQINWRSFTSDLEANFTLSALPTRLKERLIEKSTTFRRSMSNGADLRRRTHSHSETDVNASAEANSVAPPSTTFKKNLFHSASRTSLLNRKAASSHSAVDLTNTGKEHHHHTKQFDWDEFFEKNHKISSNQNFRFSSLLESSASSTSANAGGLVIASTGYRKAQASSDPNENKPTQNAVKRLANKLNSYKDARFHPYAFIDAANSEMSAHQQHHSGATSSSSNTGISGTIDDILADFGFDSSHYVKMDFNKENYVWDNTFANNIDELYQDGYAVLCTKQFGLKSICYLCASGPESDAQLIYCSVCCQGFHEFCLKKGSKENNNKDEDSSDYEVEDERPDKNSPLLDWVCPNCKYCEICFLPDNLLTCDLCKDHYHADCLKKSHYPNKHSKFNNKWLCRKCFECKICKNRNIFYEKKLFNKMHHFDFSTCLKCHEKYKLEKPLGCCNKMITLENSSVLDRTLFQCDKCFDWSHFSCLPLPAHDIEILKNNTQLLNSIECHLCDASLKTINEKLSQIKEIIFKEIFCHIEQTSGESLTSFWEQRNNNNNDSETSSKDLFVTLADFLVYLSSCDPIKFSQSDLADIRVKLDEAINKKYPYLSGYVNKIEEKTTTTTTSEESAIKVEKVETNEAEVPKTNESEQDQIDKIRLEETVQADEENKQEEPMIYERLVSNLIRPPYDDHLYSFTNSSILESRFNETSRDYDQLNSEEEKSTYLKKLINEALRKDRSLADLEPDEPFRNEQSDDNRECIACRLIGDHAICGRLLPLDLYWIHANCLLLVDGVSVDSNLVQNLQNIYAKQKTVCGRCQKEGALLTCQNQYCQSNFHLNCAYESNCYFGAKPSHSEALTTSSSSKKQSHKTTAPTTPSYVFMCSEHKPRQTSAEWELAMNEQRLRMLLVEPKELRDELSRRKVPSVKYFAKTSSAATPRAQVGSLFVESFGDLETTSDFKSYLCPIGYSCVRLFWSTKEIGRKCLYKCRIYAAGDFKSREAIDLITRGYLEKLNANRLVVIDEDLNIKISPTGDYEDEVHVNKSEESTITPLNDQENKTCVAETDAVKMAQLDGTNDEDALAPNKKPPVINLNNLPPNKGIIRMSAPSINLNGNSATTTGGVKFFQKMHNDQPPSSSSVKKIANHQILLNNQSAVVGSDKPKVLKMDPQRIINIKNSFMNVDRPQINPCNIIRSQPTAAPRTKLQQQQYQTAHSTGIYHPACASSSSSSQPCSYLNINTQHSAMAALSAVAAAASASPSGNSNNDMYLNLVSPKSDKSDSSLNLNHSSFMNPLISHLPPMHDSSGASAYDSSSASSMSNNAAAMFSFANQRQTLNLNRPIFLNAQHQQQQQQQMAQVKDVKEKKLSSKKEKQLEKKGAKKRSEGEPRSNKCTVAALLSQISRPAEPAAPSPPPQTSSISLLGSTLPTASFQAPSTPSALSSSPTNTPTENSSSTKKTSATKKPKNPNKSAKKNGNKLRDYFGSSVSSAADSTPLLADINNSKTDRISPPFFDDGSTIMTNESSDLLAAGKTAKAKKMKRKENNFVEVSVATKKFKASAVAVATECDADYSAQSQLVFEIISEDGLRVISYDINQAWKAIMDRLRAIRLRHKLKPHFNKAVNGVKMYGLTSRAVAFLLEQHNSIEFCPTYRCKYVNREWMQAATSNEANTKWVVNLNNAARTMRRDETERRKFPDRFYWLTSEHRHLNLNLSQRFDQAFMQASKALTSLDLSTSMKYRHLKEFSKNALIVKRSNIHHRGLFTLVDLQQSQMIIEYAGEIIRNELCEKREKYYESKGIGCYMFRIDEFEVIDATTKGNQARFINHSCDPNCVSRVLLIQGHKHIVIFAQRAISRGEELTYDYKFPKEDDKIKCLCKSAKCRKYLN